MLCQQYNSSMAATVQPPLEFGEIAGCLGEGQWKSLLKRRLKKVAGPRSEPRLQGNRTDVAARKAGSARDLGLNDQVVYAPYD